MNQDTSDANADDEAVDAAAQEWFVLNRTGTPTEEDRRQFRLWLEKSPRHAAAYDELEAVWTDVASLRVAFEPSEPEVRSESTPASAERAPAPEPRQAMLPTRSRTFAWGSLAVAFTAFAVVFGPSAALQLEADHLTGVGERANAQLPDGSVAWLNSDTAIAVEYSNDVRRVSLLKGEAQFEVSPDQARPFVVAAAHGTATAVGTVFTVRELQRASAVTVVEGIVDVEAFERSSTGAPEETRGLTETQRVYLRGGAGVSSVETVNLSSVGAWKEGYISIQDLPVAQALAELDRYRPGKIVLMAKENNLNSITARVAIDTLDDGLNAIAATNGLSVIRVTDYLVIVR